MTSIRAFAEKVHESRAKSGCFTFHDLGGETLKHERKTIAEQRFGVFYSREHRETLKQLETVASHPSVSRVSQAETGVEQQGPEPSIPVPYRAAFADLCATCPAGVPGATLAASCRGR